MGPAPRYLRRDRDASYGQHFRRRVDAMGITEVVTAPCLRRAYPRMKTESPMGKRPVVAHRRAGSADPAKTYAPRRMRQPAMRKLLAAIYSVAKHRRPFVPFLNSQPLDNEVPARL
jgi:hypothetical protein